LGGTVAANNKKSVVNFILSFTQRTLILYMVALTTLQLNTHVSVVLNSTFPPSARMHLLVFPLLLRDVDTSVGAAYRTASNATGYKPLKKFAMVKRFILPQVTFVLKSGGISGSSGLKLNGHVFYLLRLGTTY